MAYDIEVKAVEARLVASIRVTTTPDAIGGVLGELLPEVWSSLAGRGVTPVGPPFARYYEYGADRVDLEAGLPLSEAVAAEGRIVAGELPAGRVAATWHVGPYDRLREAYLAIEAWLAAHGETAAGARWEIYWTDPGQEPDPARWRTEVLQPIR